MVSRYERVKKRFYSESKFEVDEKQSFEELEMYENVSRKIRRFVRCEIQRRKDDVKRFERRFRIVSRKCTEKVNESMKKWLELPKKTELKINLEGTARKIRSKVAVELLEERRRRSDIRKRLGKILRRRIKMEPITSAFVLWKQVNCVEARRERWERRKIGDDDGDDIMMGLLLKNRTSIVESRGKYSFARLYCVYCCKRRVFRAWIGYMAGDTSL